MNRRRHGWWFLLCCLVLLGCGEVSRTVMVDNRFTTDELQGIVDAADTWNAASGAAVHVELEFGHRVEATWESSEGRVVLVRVTDEAEAAAADPPDLHDLSYLGDTVARTRGGVFIGEIIAVMPERITRYGDTLRSVVAHEFGHHLGLHHRGPGLMQDGAPHGVDRFVEGRCLSADDLDQLDTLVGLGPNARACP